MKYANIIFLQDEEARTLVDKLERVDGVVAHGATAAGIVELTEYLAQWDYGDESEHDVRDEPSGGSTDHVERVQHGGSVYLLTWNLGLGYVRLERILEEA